jgi:hypothetical protein
MIKKTYSIYYITISKVCKDLDDVIEFNEAVNYLLHLIDCYDYKCEYPFKEITERIEWTWEKKEIKEKYLRDLKTHLLIKEELKIFDIIYG